MVSINRIRTERLTLDLAKFGGVFTNLKFVHLSDLHISRFGHRERNLIRLVNKEKPDLVLITGDLVVNYENAFSGCLETLKRVKARYGIYAVFGNADHTFNPIIHLHRFKNALDGINVTLLNNKNVELRLDNNSLYLVGVDDPFYHFDNFEEAISGVPSNAPTILLAHSPDILFPRADALVINLLDSPSKRDHHKKWGWKDSTHFSPENGDVFFQNSGKHILRVQSRQHGVLLDTILLNPYKEIDDALRGGDTEGIHRMLKSPEAQEKYPELVIIPSSNVRFDRIFGKWRKVPDDSALFRSRMDDLPAQRKWHFQPLMDPENFFEVEVYANRGTKYHVWIRMKAHNGSPKNDSVYLQFSDSSDENGKERYRIGNPAYSKERMSSVDLILAGHTHGGQIRIPFYGPVETMTSMGKKYAAGLHRIGETLLYVSRGVGTSMLPIRLFCPPEITVLSFI